MRSVVASYAKGRRGYLINVIASSAWRINTATELPTLPQNHSTPVKYNGLNLSPVTSEDIDTSGKAMTKVSTLVAFATFLVFGINTSDAVSSVDERLWTNQCREERNYEPGVIANRREDQCFWACILKKGGMMKDGKLAEREKTCDIMVDMANGSPIELKDGKTIRQLVEECYDEGNLKTEECEIAAAMRNCVQRGMVR